MANEERPLSNAERAELEELRAQKAAREERAELDRLRAEQAREQQARQRQAPSAQELAAKERARRFMEPGEDLSMPLGQRIVLIALAVIVIAVIAVYLSTHH